MKNTYMLFAGWKVRIVKNCDRGLEFFTVRTDPKPVNNFFFPPLSNYFVFIPDTLTQALL